MDHLAAQDDEIDLVEADPDAVETGRDRACRHAAERAAEPIGPDRRGIAVLVLLRGRDRAAVTCDEAGRRMLCDVDPQDVQGKLRWVMWQAR